MKTVHDRKGCRCPEGSSEQFCLGNDTISELTERFVRDFCSPHIQSKNRFRARLKEIIEEVRKQEHEN